MKVRAIERRHNSLEPELEATPCLLTNEEKKAIGGGYGCTCYGGSDSCDTVVEPVNRVHLQGGSICENFSRYFCP